MKLAYTYIIAGLTSILFLSSCEKTKAPGGSTGDCKISAISGFHPSLTTISYDENGRVLTISAGSSLLRTLTYLDDDVKVESRRNGAFESTSYIELDDKKNIKTQKIEYKDGKVEFITYTYTNDKLTTEHITSNTGNYSIAHTWEGGNLVRTRPNAGVNALEKIEYHQDMAFQAGDVNYITRLMKDNWVVVGRTANLVRSNYGQDSISYKADNSGKIIQAKILRHGYPTQVLNYQYSCK